MKRLLFLPLLLAFTGPADATYIDYDPFAVCYVGTGGGGTVCTSELAVASYGAAVMASRSHCKPGDPVPCQLEWNDTGEIQIRQLSGNGCDIKIYNVIGTVYYVDPIAGHYVQWQGLNAHFVCKIPAPNPPQSCGQQN